ncbi:MAG: Gfo/Idh/MocA family oxidoreductase [Propionivibrio sp.]
MSHAPNFAPIPERRLRFALLGCGFFAQNHLHAWRDIADVELVAVCDIDPARAHAAAAEFGGRAYTSAEELFACEQLDFVDIASTPPSHRPLVELAARHGVAVICQKPLAWTLEDGTAMVAACKVRGLPFMVHENFRWQHPMREVKRILDAGAIGRPFFGRISFRTAHDVYAAQPWLVDSERMIIIDVAVHLLDLARFYLGEPDSLYARALRVNPRIRGEDAASILLGYEHASCLVNVSYETRSDHNTYPQTFVTLEGNEGTITLGADYHLQVVSRAEVTERTLVIPDHGWTSQPWDAIQDSVSTIQRHWVTCLRSGRTPETSGESTLQLLKLTLASYRSAESGEAIRFGADLPPVRPDHPRRQSIIETQGALS